MKKITVAKGELIDILNKNKEKHQKEYDEAMQGYKETVIEHYEQALENFKINPDVYMFKIFEKPTCHVKDYDRAIGMLTMHIPRSIELSIDEYRQYVDDEWDWKERFVNNSMSYSR